jgi:hypothetical protein
MHIVIGFIVLLFAGSLALYAGKIVDDITSQRVTKQEGGKMLAFYLPLWLAATIVAVWIIARG